LTAKNSVGPPSSCFDVGVDRIEYSMPWDSWTLLRSKRNAKSTDIFFIFAGITTDQTRMTESTTLIPQPYHSPTFVFTLVVSLKTRRKMSAQHENSSTIDERWGVTKPNRSRDLFVSKSHDSEIVPSEKTNITGSITLRALHTRQEDGWMC
jgi:predicted nucleotide-binding protein